MASRVLQTVRRKAAARNVAEREFRDAVLAAHASGESYRAIASQAGLSHVRILQIVKEAK